LVISLVETPNTEIKVISILSVKKNTLSLSKLIFYLMKSFLLILSLFSLSTLFAQSLVDISPNQAEQGETLNVTITGTNTSFDQATNTTIQFYFTASTTTATIPNSFFIQSSETILANLTVPAGTASGWYDYSVANEIDGYLLSPTSFNVDSTASITSYNTNKEYKVYPNPFKDALTIDVSNSKSETATLSLINITGKVFESRKVSLKNGQNSFEMNNLDLDSGIYFVQLTYSNGKRYSTKIIKH
jgi:hypothetical protein